MQCHTNISSYQRQRFHAMCNVVPTPTLSSYDEVTTDAASVAPTMVRCQCSMSHAPMLLPNDSDGGGAMRCAMSHQCHNLDFPTCCVGSFGASWQVSAARTPAGGPSSRPERHNAMSYQRQRFHAMCNTVPTPTLSSFDEVTTDAASVAPTMVRCQCSMSHAQCCY